MPIESPSQARSVWIALLPLAIGLGHFPAIASAAAPAPAHPVRLPEPPLPLAQSTSVSGLSDISPTDWAFQAVNSLAETYGCLQGYPDRTWRGDRPLIRFEFAAGLNACLVVMAGLIAQGGVSPEDLATLTWLEQEFRPELMVLAARVTTLESETATLQAQQFSTTTRLQGQADFHLGLPFDPVAVFDEDNDPEVVENSVSIAARARLNFDTSFTGDDRLRLRLQGRSGDFLDPFGGLADGGNGDYDRLCCINGVLRTG